MGVRMLNKYLKEYSSDAIKEITLNDLRKKKIVIDISIFLYQFKGSDALLENFYKMIMLFRDYQVVPIFVFDGTPPEEKSDILNKRDQSKKMAQRRCETLEHKLQNNNFEDDIEKNQLQQQLKEEQRKCIRITNANIRDVKALMNILGVSFVEAEGEADELCVHLVKKNVAWACMTEDMDMFVYGCLRVIRCFNIEKGTALLYSTVNILKNLKMSQSEFRDVCLLAGTDYNRSRFNIFTTMGFFYKYLRKRRGHISFYDWLIYTKTITSEYKECLQNSGKIFSVTSYSNLDIPQFTNRKIMKDEVNSYLEKHNINYLINV